MNLMFRLNSCCYASLMKVPEPGRSFNLECVMPVKRSVLLLILLFTMTGLAGQSCMKAVRENPEVILPPAESRSSNSLQSSSVGDYHSGDDSSDLKSQARQNASRGGKQSRSKTCWNKARQIVYGKAKNDPASQLKRYNRFDIERATLDYGKFTLKEVALTFDDGPHREYTPQILKILKRYNVKATFFIVGRMAEMNKDLVIAQHRDGHLIGNHTYHHVNLTTISENEARVEWVACNEVVREIVGIAPRFCRPPGGNYDDTVRISAMKSGLVTVLWTEDPGDYEEPGGPEIESRIFYSICNGGIILLHDGVQQTINVLPSIIERLHDEGYTFVTADEMYRKRKK